MTSESVYRCKLISSVFQLCSRVVGHSVICGPFFFCKGKKVDCLCETRVCGEGNREDVESETVGTHRQSPENLTIIMRKRSKNASGYSLEDAKNNVVQKIAFMQLWNEVHNVLNLDQTSEKATSKVFVSIPDPKPRMVVNCFNGLPMMLASVNGVSQMSMICSARMEAQEERQELTKWCMAGAEDSTVEISRQYRRALNIYLHTSLERMFRMMIQGPLNENVSKNIKGAPCFYFFKLGWTEFTKCLVLPLFD
ncbi:hypothetical protein C8R45DRAFT_935642 [Mycena sanguinolenta]|nr:hypothetical protein C8R45DRAFT_935642 [Mycena sanguinolenta]